MQLTNLCLHVWARFSRGHAESTLALRKSYIYIYIFFQSCFVTALLPGHWRLAFHRRPGHNNNIRVLSQATLLISTETMSQVTIDVDKLPALVIFDKDGTLIDFQSTWSPWVTALATSLEVDCDFDVSRRLYDVMGYCDKTDTISDSSLLAYASMDRIKEEIKILLLEGGVEKDDVDALLRKCWSEGHANNTSRPYPTTDLPVLFTWLRQAGIKVAVCTSDSRASTESALRKLQVRKFIDAVVCSDDENMEAKPSPRGVLKICADLGVHPLETVVVGDTTADMLMAKSAGVGLILGVLTGIGTEKELANYADVIINNVETITTLFTEPE